MNTDKMTVTERVAQAIGRIAQQTEAVRTEHQQQQQALRNIDDYRTSTAAALSARHSEQATLTRQLHEAVAALDQPRIAELSAALTEADRKILEAGRLAACEPDRRSFGLRMDQLKADISATAKTIMAEEAGTAVAEILEMLRVVAQRYIDHEEFVKQVVSGFARDYGFALSGISQELNFRLARYRDGHPVPDLVRALHHQNLKWFVDGQGQTA